MPKMTGARCIAETFKGYGVTHVFFAIHTQGSLNRDGRAEYTPNINSQ